ncbi:hypothetical protein CN998_26890 [Bacillus cereus]|nr:hypothetical protein CN998_26890 [Bacillus cereus]
MTSRLCQEVWLMNIQYGNGAFIVVRARESLVHGEGRQSVRLKMKLGRCERHHAKSKSSIKQPAKTESEGRL